MKKIAALYVRADSIYKSMPEIDAWDAERDARLWTGGSPVIAHPPCRAWGRLRQFAHPRPDEKELALHAVQMVRTWGGVLEHPAQSTLWAAAGLPMPGNFEDEHGGYTVEIDQWHWGHKAKKPTWLYIVGAKRLPAMPRKDGKPEYVVRPAKNGTGAKIISKQEREITPPDLAEWLYQVACQCV